VGNDIVRAVSHSDAPTHNIFLYSLTGRSLVHVLPPAGADDGSKGGAVAGEQTEQRRRPAEAEVVVL
jgi:hypothetical protein